MGKRSYVPREIKEYVEYCFEEYPTLPDALNSLMVTNQRVFHASMTIANIETILELCTPRMREFAEHALIRPAGSAEDVAISLGIPKGRGRAWKGQLIYAFAALSGVIAETFTPIMVEESPMSSRIYGIWAGMMQRCSNKKASGYKNYGGRGIKVCEEWKQSFFAFEGWAREHGYRDNLTIDRIDNNGNYEPENCRWATRKQQQNNRRSNIFVEVCGEQLTVAEAADKYGVERSKAYQRIRLGWTGDQMVFGKNAQ